MNSEKLREKARNFYNQSAQSFSQTRKYWWEDLEFIKEYIPRNGKVLDFGCGNGRFFDFMKKNNFQGKYVGVDISSGLIKIAKEKYFNEKFLVVKKEDSLNFEDEEFDAIFSIAVFHHFNPNMAEKALREFKRILKRDGILIVTVWYLWSTKYKKELLGNFLKGELNLTTELTFKDEKRTYYRPCYWWRKAQMERLIKRSGMKIRKKFFTFDKKGGKRNMCFVCEK